MSRRGVIGLALVVLLASLAVFAWTEIGVRRCADQGLVFNGRACVPAAPPVILQRDLHRT